MKWLVYIWFCFIGFNYSVGQTISYNQVPKIKVLFDVLEIANPIHADSLAIKIKTNLTRIHDTLHIVKADHHFALALIYFNNKDFDKALQHIGNARNLYKLQTLGYQDAWLSTLNGKILFYRGNYLLAAQMYYEVLQILKNQPNTYVEDYARDGLLQVYNMNTSINLTPGFFLKSYDIKNNLGDKLGMLRVAEKLVNLYFQSNAYEAALHQSENVIKHATELHLTDEVKWGKIDKASILTRLKKYDQAISILSALESSTNKTDLHTTARLYATWGDYYLLQGDELKAEEYYQKALPPRISPSISQYVYKKKAETYFFLKNYEKAYNAQEQYIKHLTTAHIPGKQEGILNIEERSARIKLNDEIKYLNLQNQLKDSLFLKEKALAQILEVNNQIANQQLSDQKALSDAMQREVKFQNQKLKDEKKIRLLLLGSALAFLLMGFVIYNLYRKQIVKSKIISLKSSENEVLMKEIHHRVKNNLQIISSLLDMQSLSIKDPGAANAIKEGKNRVQSMALIHQNLYKDGDIQTIQVDEYIKHLVQSLIDSYKIDDQKIAVLYDIIPLSLDVNTVVPLGLIINELVTNSIKYGLGGPHKAELYLELNKQKNNSLFFKLKDNGNGFPPDWSHHETSSFGYQLIKAFAKKLKAHLKTYNEHGAVVELEINKF